MGAEFVHNVIADALLNVAAVDHEGPIKLVPEMIRNELPGVAKAVMISFGGTRLI